jgi:glycosyltransferase involved in cell wall biosynthesis
MTTAATGYEAPLDLVHAAGLPYSSLLFTAVQLANRTRARLIMSPFTHVAPPGAAGERMRRAYLSPLNIALLSRADRIGVQTSLERELLIGAGLPVARIAEGGLGVDKKDCTGGNRARARASWSVPSDAIVVGHLGNKSWDKGTVDLIDASEAIWARGRAPFILVLAGPAMPSFTSRWARVRDRSHVIDLGELDDPSKRDFYAGIDIFALPSYVESFGLSLLEAAMNHVAVVAYDHGGPSRLFRNGATACLVPAGDVGQLSSSLERLVTNAEERGRLAAAAKELAATYPWERALASWLTSYDALLRGV